MSSRSKNFRRRTESAGDEEKPSSSPSPAAAKIPLPKKPKITKPEAPKRLSFAEDEEEEDGPFAHRPAAAPRHRAATSAVHKVTLAKDRSVGVTPKVPVYSNVQPQAGEYTKERLLDLQKNARHVGRSKTNSQMVSELTERNPEPVIVLKGLLKPSVQEVVPRPPVPVRRQEVEEEMDEDEDGDVGENKQFAKLGIDGKGRGAIPDQAEINKIRAKREQLRQSRGPAPEYISLDGGGAVSSRASGGGSSDEEDTEFRGRVALFGDQKDGTVKKGVFEDIDERVTLVDSRAASVGVEVEEDDEDEEERKWEEEQFRKAIGKRIEGPFNRGPNNIPTIGTVQPQPSIYSEVGYQPTSSSLLPGPSFGATYSVEAMSIGQLGDVALQAFFATLERNKETNKGTLTGENRIDENMLEIITEITALEKSLDSNGEKYIFVQKFRDFVSGICQFAEDKATFIDELEEYMQKLHEERAASVEDRRDSDIADEQNEVEAAVSAAMSILSKGSGSAFANAATTAAQAAALAAKESLNLPAQLDEYGRDTNLQRRMDYTRRAEQRKRKRAQSETRRMSLVEENNEYKYIEGELSTDESDSESSAYQSTRDELLKTAGQIFSDATDEYSNLSSVKEQFESCKKLYPSIYRDAYISLSVPTIFSRFVRLELLKWDPLYSRTIFGDMEWHNLLLDYGLPGEEQSFDTDDADDKLVPELVEKVALPILHHEIEHCWDVLSTKRTENAVFAADMIMSYISLDSKALHELLAVVCSRLTKAITTLDVPTWNSVVINAVPGAAQYTAYKFGMSLRLLRNICSWKGVLPLPVLEKLALEELLIVKLLPHVRSSMSNIHDALRKIERIVGSLSGVWYGANIQGVNSQKLQPLVECVVELGRKLEKRHAAGVNEEETHRLVRRLKTMLVELDERERARTMLRTFKLKEAL